jgi:hypothetical protein
MQRGWSHKRVNAALRWTAVTSWAGIILGDSMPAAWFNYLVTPVAKWDHIQLLSHYSKDVYATDMSEMVNQLKDIVLVATLQGPKDYEFPSWFDGRVDPLGYPCTSDVPVLLRGSPAESHK